MNAQEDIGFTSQSIAGPLRSADLAAGNQGKRLVFQAAARIPRRNAILIWKTLVKIDFQSERIRKT
jgi:hypothetical protein